MRIAICDDTVDEINANGGVTIGDVQYKLDYKM